MSSIREDGCPGPVLRLCLWQRRLCAVCDHGLRQTESMAKAGLLIRVVMVVPERLVVVVAVARASVVVTAGVLLATTAVVAATVFRQS
jgi:hypothetical protein